jgi:Flp pilus assembly pilin Flp
MASVGRFGLLVALCRQSSLSLRNEEFQVTSLLRTFLQDEQGQDLIEYTLLLAFVCLASAALFIAAGGSVGGIWSSANSDLAVANTSAS